MKGEFKHPSDRINEIRSYLFEAPRTAQDIAVKFGITEQHANDIIALISKNCMPGEYIRLLAVEGPKQWQLVIE